MWLFLNDELTAEALLSSGDSTISFDTTGLGIDKLEDVWRELPSLSGDGGQAVLKFVLFLPRAPRVISMFLMAWSETKNESLRGSFEPRNMPMSFLHRWMRSRKCLLFSRLSRIWSISSCDTRRNCIGNRLPSS